MAKWVCGGDFKKLAVFEDRTTLDDPLISAKMLALKAAIERMDQPLFVLGVVGHSSAREQLRRAYDDLVVAVSRATPPHP